MKNPWNDDADGLPTFTYTGGYPARALDRAGRDAQLPDDPCFLLGNYRMTLFVHASGRLEFITGERGWARLNHGGKNCGWSQTQVRVTTVGGGAAGTHILAGKGAELTGGLGYVRCVDRSVDGLEITRTLAAKPSPEIHRGNPAFLIETTLRNRGTEPVTVQYREEILAHYLPMNDQELALETRRVDYPATPRVNAARGLAVADFSFQPRQLMVPPKSAEEMYTHDIAPPLLFLKADAVETRSEDAGLILGGESEVTLAPGECRAVRFVIGLTFERDEAAIDAQIADLLTAAKPRENAGPFAPAWRAVLPNFADEPDPILRREMFWNAYTLEALATYHQYFRETFVPQGSVYAFHQGMNGSNRDHLQHALPLMFTNPALAKSCLRHALKHSLHDGEIKRQNIGFGYSDPGIYMESDPQLYMFMAIAEYLRVTGDHAFLDELVEYYPRETGRTDSVLTFLAKHFIYLRDLIGTGKHGLVKMLNSDWSDSFFHRLSPNIYRLFAESHLNSTMALAVLPPLIRELKRAGEKVANPHLAANLGGELEAYHTAIHAAVMHDLEGRTFAPRCYVGEHDEPALNFGVEHLCLEAQPFLLQAESFPVERKRALYHEIRTRVLDMEKIGARTREVPINDPEGRGEDGGIWWAHQGPLITGVATFDREEALRLLRQLTFHHFAAQYPDYWLGQWTSADSLESTLSRREGLYAFWLPGAFQPFCAHAHAWMLYSYFKVRREAAPDGCL